MNKRPRLSGTSNDRRNQNNATNVTIANYFVIMIMLEVVIVAMSFLIILSGDDFTLSSEVST